MRSDLQLEKFIKELQSVNQEVAVSAGMNGASAHKDPRHKTFGLCGSMGEGATTLVRRGRKTPQAR